ncbi:MAG: transglutaminase-like domain-containing protein [Verrucomicrobiota bacterium]
MTSRFLATCLLIGSSMPGCVQAAILQLEAGALFEQSLTHNLRLASDGKQIELEAGELFEDDGPAAGHSYQKPENRERVTAQTWIRKELVIPNPRARAAHLLVLSDEPFQGQINGIGLTLGDNQSGRQGYQSFSFDPKILRAGSNEIILRDSGRVMIARDDEFALGSRTRIRHPNRSAKSVDAGKTWDDQHLGPGGQLDGEYGVRLFLDQYRSEGLLTLPILDAGNLENKALASPVGSMRPIKVSLLADSAGGKVLMRARSGETYVPEPQHWSEWTDLGEAGGTFEPRGRYLQVAVELTTLDPLQSPRVKSLVIESSPVIGTNWTSEVQVLDAQNEQIVRTDIPFQYEPLDHPRLKQLREQYRLDELTRGATNELDLLLRLAQWACNAWDWPNHITEAYPPWDALAILKPHADGKPVGGFCQQFNVVFLQACESFGFSGRAVSISQGGRQAQCPGGGHEIVELWSNEWKKWVYVDGALAWYITDEKTGRPLSIWELRQSQLPTLRGQPVPEVRVIDAPRTRNRQFVWKGLAGPEPLNWYLELRMIPRSNFVQEKSPLPLNQGTEEWAWTGHYVWTDEAAPAGLIFGNRVNRRDNFEWTLNQAHYVLEPAEQPGQLRVHLDTVTPSFETFLAEIDGAEKKPVASVFNWTLHRGRNQLRVRPRNLAGREGVASWITLSYAPK